MRVVVRKRVRLLSVHFGFPFVFACSLFAGGISRSEQAADPIAALRPGHPRLLATAEDWDRQIALTRTDPVLRQLSAHVVAHATALQDEPVSTRKLQGRRLLGTSRRVLGRIVQLATAYRLTGDAAHVRRAEQELLAVAAFSDWNPAHFLDVAEMTAAVAIGYDEFFAEFSPPTRATLRDVIVNLGLRPGLDPTWPHNSWHRRANNWNQVCWSGLTLGALAVAEDEPELAREILRLARANIGYGLKPYEPDGLYPEGPSYWSYGTTYQVLMIEALRHATGDDWDMPGSLGFLDSSLALTQLTGPAGMTYNFSDAWASSDFAPALLWFVRERNDSALLSPHLANLERWSQDKPAIAADRFAPLALLWRSPLPSRSGKPLPLAWRSFGEQPVATLRSSWDDPATAWLAAKGGSASLNHGHMDAGSFVLEADGVRWAIDLGAQNYQSLESRGLNLFDRRQDSDRWRVFRLSNLSHNTLVIDGQLQRVAGHSSIERFSADDENPFVIFDLAPVYGDQLTRAHRGFRLDRHRRVLIRDELAGLRAGADVRWAMVTGAEISIAADGRSAVLRQDGKTLQATLLASGGLRFTTRPAAPPPDDFNHPNPGRFMLLIHATAPSSGNLDLTVLLTPGSASDATPPILRSLSDW